MTKKILIAAGGTGGHIFPGLALAKILINQGYLIEWIGTLQGLEAKLIPQNKINIYYINIGGLRGKNWLTKVLAPFYIFTAIVQSIWLLIKLQPSIVLGMGGFVSGPVGIAAWLLRKKLIIHEQNAIAGTSNRILAFFADHILESFANSFPRNRKYHAKTLLIGNPIREEIFAASSLPIKDRRSDIFNILVLGGSRGARFLNQIVPEALSDLNNVKIVHQTGEQDLDYTIKLYLQYKADHQHIIQPFIDDMLAAYLAADLVICRAGAATIFEIMALGVASIMIPLPWSIDDHQTKNAKYLAEHNAGILIPQIDLTPIKLQELVLDLKNNSNKIYNLKNAARSLYESYKLNNPLDQIFTIIN